MSFVCSSKIFIVYSLIFSIYVFRNGAEETARPNQVCLTDPTNIISMSRHAVKWRNSSLGLRCLFGIYIAILYIIRYCYEIIEDISLSIGKVKIISYKRGMALILYKYYSISF